MSTSNKGSIEQFKTSGRISGFIESPESDEQHQQPIQILALPNSEDEGFIQYKIKVAGVICGRYWKFEFQNLVSCVQRVSCKMICCFFQWRQNSTNPVKYHWGVELWRDEFIAIPELWIQGQNSRRHGLTTTYMDIHENYKMLFLIWVSIVINPLLWRWKSYRRQIDMERNRRKHR